MVVRALEEVERAAEPSGLRLDKVVERLPTSCRLLSDRRERN